MQSTIYVEMAPGVRIEDLYEQLKISYEVYPFMSLLVTSLHIDVVSTSLQKCKVMNCICADHMKSSVLNGHSPFSRQKNSSLTLCCHILPGFMGLWNVHNFI